MGGSTGLEESTKSSATRWLARISSLLLVQQESLTPDEIFTVLSHRRRRFAIYYLKGVEGPVELGEVAEQVAAWEYKKETSEITADERKRLYTALNGSHLPPMEKVGLIAFDKDRGTVEPKDALYELDIYVDIVLSRDFHWSTYYLGLSILATAAFLLHSFELISESIIGLPDLMTFVLGAFLFSSIVHKWLSRRNRLDRNERPPEIE